MSVLNNVLFSYRYCVNLPRCYSNLPQIGWLKTKKIYFLTVLDSRRLKFEVLGPHSLCRLGGRIPSSSLRGSGDCHHPLLCGGFTPASASVVTLLPALRLSQFSSCFSPIRTCVIEFRAHPE